MARLDLLDIQGIILNGYGSLRFARFLFLKIKDRAGAQKWLADRALEVATSRQWGERKINYLANCVNLALTAEGLEALGLDEETRKQFPEEFLQGMDSPERARILGDSGKSAPKHWVVGGPRRRVHVLLMLYARDREALALLSKEQEKRLRLSGAFTEVFRKDSSKPPDNKEHFGFHDGISQPRFHMEDSGEGKDPETINPGDFVLGYKNQFSQLPLSPSVPAALDRQDVLPASPLQPGEKDLGRNGSFLVFRLLEQDVVGFWKFFKGQAKKGGGSKPPETAEHLASKCVGRWPSGAPLVLSEGGDNLILGADPDKNNDFKFAKEDPHGMRCPVGSHIRRTNPRDSLQANMGPDATSDPAASLKMVNRHRILRRGRPYGQYLQHPSKIKKAKGERGLLFFCVNASISRQFEFVQQTWVNNDKFDGLYEG